LPATTDRPRFPAAVTKSRATRASWAIGRYRAFYSQSPGSRGGPFTLVDEAFLD
jgi:hypothetical protein